MLRERDRDRERERVREGERQRERERERERESIIRPTCNESFIGLYADSPHKHLSLFQKYSNPLALNGCSLKFFNIEHYVTEAVQTTGTYRPIVQLHRFQRDHVGAY